MLCDVGSFIPAGCVLWLTDGAKELLLLGPREQDLSCCAPQGEASAFSPLPLSSSLGNKLPGGIGAAGPSHGKPWKTMEKVTAWAKTLL